MKKQIAPKKLILKKKAILKLNNDNLNWLRGGGATESCPSRAEAGCNTVSQETNCTQGTISMTGRMPLKVTSIH